MSQNHLKNALESNLKPRFCPKSGPAKDTTIAGTSIQVYPAIVRFNLLFKLAKALHAPQPIGQWAHDKGSMTHNPTP